MYLKLETGEVVNGDIPYLEERTHRHWSLETGARFEVHIR